jgi:histone H3/H4
VEILKMENIDNISKPSITRLARQAGIKSLSEDCFETVRNLIDDKLNEVVKTILVVNSEHQTKTVMVGDVYKALQILNYNVAESSYLNTKNKS